MERAFTYVRERELQFTAGVINNNGMLKLHKANLKTWQECLNVLSVKRYSWDKQTASVGLKNVKSCSSSLTWGVCFWTTQWEHKQLVMKYA